MVPIMPNSEQVARAFQTIIKAIDQYGDDIAPAEIADVLAVKARDAVLLRIEQFAGRDVSHEQLYAFIASDVLVAIGETHRGSKFAFDMMYTPKSVVWAYERRHMEPRGFFVHRERTVANQKLTEQAMEGRKDIAWAYQTTPGSTFEEVVRAVTAFVPLAVADALRSLR